MKTKVLKITKKDLKIETYRGSGPGGQNRNKVETGIRITHIETGIKATCCSENSQVQNKKNAFRVLVSRLMLHYYPPIVKERVPDEVIRTYNQPDNRVKDHASNQTFSYKETVEDANLSNAIDARRNAILLNQISENKDLKNEKQRNIR